jgi:hypothetical protein
MKKLYLFIPLLALLMIKGYSQVAFTNGNLVVYTVGDGTDTLSSAAFPVSLDEYTTSGTFVRSHPLPTTLIGSNKRITASGSATSEGEITTSVDNKYILATGYDTIPDPTMLSIATSSSDVVNRVIGIMAADGSLDATTALTDAFSTNNIRGATSTSNSDIWASGSGTTASSGVRYTTRGATTSTQISTTVTTIRAINIFNGQLYSTSQSHTFYGVCADGTGLPTTAGQTITLLPGFPMTVDNPYGFSINPAGNIAYVGDGNAIDTQAPIDSVGGIQKWTFDGATWTMAYILTNGLTTGVRNIVVDWSGANPVIYATSGETPSSNGPGNSIIKVVDAGVSSPFTTLAVGGTNKVLRGIAFAPVSSTVPVTLTSFYATNVSGVVKLLWATSQEINIKHFEIEKSADGIHFSTLATVTAAGVAHNYQTIDTRPFAGDNYYRLKTIDADGGYSYSKIVDIKYAGLPIVIYPNPAKDEITINHPLSVSATLLITDMQGRKIQELGINAGNTVDKISVNGLSEGQYLLKYTDNGYTSINVLNKQ